MADTVNAADAAKKRKADMLAAAKNKANSGKEIIKTSGSIEYIDPKLALNKIRIVFDNSGSMAGKKIENARTGVVEFLRNCTPNKDAVAIHLLDNNYGGRSHWDDETEQYVTTQSTVSSNILNSVLMSDLAMLASNVDDENLTDLGSTPLFATIQKALNAVPELNRMVAFSDGDADDLAYKDKTIALAKQMKIAIDTVFIGVDGSRGAATMREIAEKTGGIFLVFDPAKGVNFAEAFKYLSPAKRLMLMNEQFKKDLEAGKIK